MNIITTMAVASTFALAGCVTAEGKIVVDATTQDHKCLAEAIYYETNLEPLAGKIAVGHVILNRVKSDMYPKTICEVVYQPNSKKTGCTFSWACKSKKDPQGEAWLHSQTIASLVLNEQTLDPSNGALNFNNRIPKTRYHKTAVIGRHIFWQTPQQAKAAKRLRREQ